MVRQDDVARVAMEIDHPAKFAEGRWAAERQMGFDEILARRRHIGFLRQVVNIRNEAGNFRHARRRFFEQQFYCDAA